MQALNQFFQEVRKHLWVVKPRHIGIIVLDLNNFIIVNNAYGFEGGNEILEEVERRLKEFFKSSAIVSRAYADEFVFFIPFLKRWEDVLQYVDSIGHIFEMPFYVKKEPLKLNYNLGIAMHSFEENFERATCYEGLLETIFQNAKAACSEAKKKGPNQVQFFDLQIASHLENEFEAERLIVEAIVNNWFIFYVQPYFRADVLDVAGGEALVRIVKPGGEIIYPNKFIQNLEKSVYIERFEKWAFKAVVGLINAFKIPIGLNLPLPIFCRKDFFMSMEAEFQSLQAPIILEITERNVFEDPEKTKDVLHWLKKFSKVQVALDDFGTGYSNLSYLKDLSVDVIKISIFFVRELSRDNFKMVHLTKSIIDLAHGLGAKVLAEGVETEEQAKILTELGCDYLQGFYFEKPLPVNEFKEKFFGNIASETIKRKSIKRKSS